jgi:beta-lactamase regulating signal transducer with metallopeptidase domain
MLMTLSAAMILPMRQSVNIVLPDFLKQLAPPSLRISYVQSNSYSAFPSATAGFIFDCICLGWMIGVLCFLGWHIYRHIKFMSMVRRWSEKVTNVDTLVMFDATKSELTIRSNVKLMTCECIKTPMMIGLIRPTVLIPSFEIQSDELHSILKHELIHFKRHDLWCKIVMLVTLSLHWFNPIVHIMLKHVMELCEISCDERVLKGANEKSRAAYGEAIIGVIRNGGMTTSLSTNFFTSIEGIKSRVYAIMDTKGKRFSPFLMIVVVAFSLISMTNFSISPEYADGEVEVIYDEQNNMIIQDPFDYTNPIFGDNKNVLP